MNIKLSWLISVLCFSLVPVSASAQCKDQTDHHCWNLQYILYAAQTDFREFRGINPVKEHRHAVTPPNPDVSVGPATVPCHTSIWSSDVSVYICTAEIPAAEVEPWYSKTMADLHQLQYRWEFKTQTSGTDYYVDAGPAGCDVATVEKAYSDGSPSDGPYLADGPYFGQCPLHLEAVKQADGKAKIYFWLNSYTSPYLARKQDSPSKLFQQSAKSQAPQSASASQPTSPSASTATEASTETSAKPANEPAVAKYAACDELCQGLKKLLEDRATAFRGLAAAKTVSDDSAAGSTDRTTKLFGAASCSITNAPSAEMRSSAKNAPISRVHLAEVSEKSGARASAPPAPLRPAQYVCYWPEDSASAAESQFHDIVGLVQTLMPSNWSVHQQNQPDELSGADVTVWSARDARNKPAVHVYLNGKSVGLHVSAAD